MLVRCALVSVLLAVFLLGVHAQHAQLNVNPIQTQVLRQTNVAQCIKTLKSQAEQRLNIAHWQPDTDLTVTPQCGSETWRFKVMATQTENAWRAVGLATCMKGCIHPPTMFTEAQKVQGGVEREAIVQLDIPLLQLLQSVVSVSVPLKTIQALAGAGFAQKAATAGGRQRPTFSGTSKGPRPRATPLQSAPRGLSDLVDCSGTVEECISAFLSAKWVEVRSQFNIQFARNNEWRSEEDDYFDQVGQWPLAYNNVWDIDLSAHLYGAETFIQAQYFSLDQNTGEQWITPAYIPVEISMQFDCSQGPLSTQPLAINEAQFNVSIVNESWTKPVRTGQGVQTPWDYGIIEYINCPGCNSFHDRQTGPLWQAFKTIQLPAALRSRVCAS